MELNKKVSDIKVAQVESAVKLSETDKQQIAQIVAKIAGDSYEVTYALKPSLLGGFTIQVGDRKIDASLKTELEQMTQALKGTTHGK